MKLDLKHHYAEMKEEIEKQLRITINKFTNDSEELNEHCHYVIGTGGKRLRAIIPMLTAGMFTGDPYAAMDIGLVYELIHNFTLVHDDIMDDSKERRGQPTLWVKEGVPTAINVGDTLFAIALGIIRDMTLSASYKERMYEYAITACLDLAAGQQMDIGKSGNHTTTIMMKTASLFRYACESGAKFAMAETIEIMWCATFGNHYGMAFQLRDDILDQEKLDFNIQEACNEHTKYAIESLDNVKIDHRMLNCVTYQKILIELTKSQAQRDH